MLHSLPQLTGTTVNHARRAVLGSAVSTTSWKQESEKLNGTISEDDDLGPSLLKEVLTMLKELKNEKFEGVTIFREKC